LESIKGQPGFILHVAFQDSQGFGVSELWETQKQHDAWFNANVVPNVPAQISQEVVEVHNIQRPS
jgi:heme-degrading monooxygenase HmoA